MDLQFVVLDQNKEIEFFTIYTGHISLYLR